MSKTSATTRFEHSFDLNSLNKRVADFCHNYGLTKEVDDFKSEIQNEAAKQYSNPEEFANIYLADLLGLTLEHKLTNGNKAYTTSGKTKKFTELSELDSARNLTAALKIKSAENPRHVRLMQALAICYYRGVGTEVDHEKTFKIYQELAARKYAPAQYNLGACYLEGIGVEQDEALGNKYRNTALGQGFPNKSPAVPATTIRTKHKKVRFEDYESDSSQSTEVYSETDEETEPPAKKLCTESLNQGNRR